MPTPPATPASSPEDSALPPRPSQPQRRKLSRRASVIGTVIALVVAAGLAWLAWDLTRPEQTAAMQRGPGGGGGRNGAGGGGGGPGGPGGGGARGATTVGVATAEAADIPVNLEALGTVVSQATVRVRPQVSGVLTQVLFKEGQPVRKGQLLATIDPRSFEMALQQAVGQRMRDEAQLAAARVTLDRFETLLKQDSIARQEVDTQRATVHQLEASVVSDKAAEGTARLNLSYTRITAPIEGRVGLRAVDVGNQVSTGDANGIATITKITPIDVEFAVPQDHASWLQHNAGAFMEVRAFDRTRTTLLDTGAFASLDNQIDTQTGTVRAKARFNNTRQQLFPSQFVNVQLQVRTIQNAVVVPVTAVRQGGGGEFVFVLQEDRTVRQRSVVRGQPLGDRVQILSGLQIGERVITEGADRLRDGSRVLLPGDAPGPGGGGAGGRRRRDAAVPAGGAASGAVPAASQPFTGASAAQAPGAGRPAASPAREATNPFAGAPGPVNARTAGAPPSPAASSPTASASGPGGRRFQNMTPEERAARLAEFEKLSPEEREARRQQRRQAREAGAGAPNQP
ncbi:efflux RND transporter periplasmic adaptor subunit [Ramlibacter sp. AN1133]|uniref:efflux RND transporter periplasmic adaptor subunit n=1 Tax=Ramlibacter sp. AN1133 TaxID=3133429 RepID=UPI0030BF4613